jgi:hypothetical protein
MTTYRISGTVYMDSTKDEAMYDLEVDGEDINYAPDDAMAILHYLLQSGDIQIMPSHWEEVDE